MPTKQILMIISQYFFFNVRTNIVQRNDLLLTTTKSKSKIFIIPGRIEYCKLFGNHFWFGTFSTPRSCFGDVRITSRGYVMFCARPYRPIGNSFAYSAFTSHLSPLRKSDAKTKYAGGQGAFSDAAHSRCYTPSQNKESCTSSSQPKILVHISNLFNILFDHTVFHNLFYLLRKITSFASGPVLHKRFCMPQPRTDFDYSKAKTLS